LDQGDQLGRVQWSAVNIIGSYVKFDSVSIFILSRRHNPLVLRFLSLCTTMSGRNHVSGRIRYPPTSLHAS
jgi:hypothetical protein